MPTGLYPGNAALQSVLAALDGERLFPRNVEALISGHVHLFQSVSFATDHPAQFLSGNAGTWTDAPLPSPLPPGATPAPGAVVDNIVSTNRFGFLTIERRGGAGTGWQVIEHDRSGRTVTMCDVHEGKVKCVPMELP